MKKEKISDKVIRFGNTLKLTTGMYAETPMSFRDWQGDITKKVFDNPDARTIFISFARKNAKSSLSAIYALSLLVMKDLRQVNQEIYIVACDRAQAAILYNMVKNMILFDRQLKNMFKIVDSQKTLTHIESGGILKAVSAVDMSIQGLNPRAVFFDECGNIPGAKGRAIYSAFKLAMGAQRKPLMFLLSTQAPSDEHFFSELFDYGLEVQSGRVVDPSFIPCIYTIPKELDVFDEKNWLMANPGLGDFCSLENFRESAREAKRLPAMENAFRRFSCNQRVTAVSPFISMEVWEKNNRCYDVATLEGETAYMGIDLSSTTDLTAITLVFPFVRETIPVLAFHYKPEKTLQDHAYRDRVPYDVWEKQGWLSTTPGNVLDYSFIAAKIADLCKLYKVEGILVDRWRLPDLQKHLEEYNLTVELTPCGQGFKDMTKALEALERNLLEEKLELNENPLLRYQSASAVVVMDPSGNRKFEKASSISRIDGIVTLAMALRAVELFSGEGTSLYDSPELDKIYTPL